MTNRILSILAAVFLTSTTVFAAPPWPKIPEGDFEALRVFLRGHIYSEDEPEVFKFEKSAKAIYFYLKNNPHLIEQNTPAHIVPAKLLPLLQSNPQIKVLSEGLDTFSLHIMLSSEVVHAFLNWDKYINASIFSYLNRNEPSDFIRNVFEPNSIFHYPRGLSFEGTVQALSEAHPDSEYSSAKFKTEVQILLDQYSNRGPKESLIDSLEMIDISLGDLKLAQLMWLLWLSAQNDIERIHVLGYMDFLQYFRQDPIELNQFTQKIVLRAFQGSLWRDLVQWEIYHRKIAISWPCPYFFDTEVPRPEPEGLTKLK